MHICCMGVMKRIIGQQMSGGGSAGYHFVNSSPVIKTSRTGPFSGSSGKDMMTRTIDIDKFNSVMRTWGRKVSTQLR
jgi:hypothetical protein